MTASPTPQVGRPAPAAAAAPQLQRILPPLQSPSPSCACHASMRERAPSSHLTSRTAILLPSADLTEAGEQQAQALNDLLKADDTFAQITGNHSVRLVVSPLSR